MRVLVTGGDGFLGRHVVTILKKQRKEVIPFDIKVSSSEGRLLDVRDTSQVSTVFGETKPDVVVHLAALAGAAGKGGGRESIDNPFNYLQTNFMGTLCVLEACRKVNIRKVIYMSSFSPYGLTKEPITENTPVSPSNPYGLSKLCGELVVKCYASNYGIKSIIFRAPLLCGKGQKELNALREFALTAIRGQPLVLFNEGRHVREWLHPSDIANAFLKGIDYFERMSEPYETFVLGNKPISMKSLAELVINEVGSGTIRGGSCENGVFDQFTDASKALTVLGWKATITVEEIVREVVADISSQELH